MPDEVTNEIVEDRLVAGRRARLPPRRLPTHGRAGRGPRRDAGPARGTLDAVLELTVDEDAVVERLLKRAEVEGRSDDTEDVIRERQAIYRRETAPLAKHYADAGLLVQVDGMGEMDEVTDRILTALPARASD